VPNENLFLYFSLDDAIRISIEISKLHHKKQTKIMTDSNKKKYIFIHTLKKKLTFLSSTITLKYLLSIRPF
jgi:hypothetical protein